nr:zinc ribbon domain-containing protein [uncultured Alistipes sp.]
MNVCANRRCGRRGLRCSTSTRWLPPSRPERSPTSSFPNSFDLVINNYQNTDGSPNEDYCIYCCKDGRFAQDVTMEQMIDPCASSPMK